MEILQLFPNDGELITSTGEISEELQRHRRRYFENGTGSCDDGTVARMICHFHVEIEWERKSPRCPGSAILVPSGKLK
jgi:hypothetical protein